jgi:hypothetical protein
MRAPRMSLARPMRDDVRQGVEASAASGPVRRRAVAQSLPGSHDRWRLTRTRCSKRHPRPSHRSPPFALGTRARRAARVKGHCTTAHQGQIRAALRSSARAPLRELGRPRCEVRTRTRRPRRPPTGPPPRSFLCGPASSCAPALRPDPGLDGFDGVAELASQDALAESPSTTAHARPLTFLPRAPRRRPRRSCHPARRACAADPAAAGGLPVPRPRRVPRLVRGRPPGQTDRVHGRLTGAVGLRRPRRDDRRGGVAGAGRADTSSHRRPNDPAATP